MSIVEQSQTEDLVADPLSAALGQEVFVTNHRYGDMFIALPQGGRTPRLRFSRYYWRADPPIAVDWARDLRFGKAEVRMKIAYCAEHGVRYYVCKDENDVETLQAQVPGMTEDEDVPVVHAPPRTIPL